MKVMRRQKSWMALLALLFIFAACKGESPTAPPPGGGPGPGPSPTGFAVTLTASNANPVVDSVVTISAAVTQNGQPAPDGTAVEFVANGGSFSATEIVTSLLRTTTNGVASVELRSTLAGPIRVQATVGNVSRTVDVTFRVSPTIPPPSSTAPSITSVSPTIGIPAGGQRVIITGKNFKIPLRVLFDTGGPLPVEAFVISSTETQIEVFTPPVNLGVDQQLVSDITVITQAGSVNEQSATLEEAFTFRNEVLEPRISTASPNSGPVTGGTRVTLFGDGFQSPVQVLFGAAEARVINVEFGQIIVEAPAARDTSSDGSGVVTGPVNITVRNINSQTFTTLLEGFRYVAAMRITNISPLRGSAVGGTELTIEGIGFVSPLEVTVVGVQAQVLGVAGTRVRVRTSPLSVPCSSQGGQVIVRNTVNGDFDIFGDVPEEQSFIYQAVEPRIISLTPGPDGPIPGSSVGAIVRDPGVGPLGIAQVGFELGSRAVPTSPNQISNGAGDQNFSFIIPLNVNFPSVACTVDGVPGLRSGPSDVPVTFRNRTTECFDTITEALRIVPDPLTNICVVPPPPDVEQVIPISPACANAGNVAVAGGSATATIRFRNAGGRNLIINPDTTITGAHPGDFDIPPDSVIIAPGATGDFEFTFDPTAIGPRTANIRFTTNDPDPGEDEFTICVQGNGT